MRRTTTALAAVVAAAALMAATASAAAARTGIPAAQAGTTAAQGDAGTAPAAKPATDDPGRAHALYVEANALLSQPKQWRRAARLYERSAELRDAADPEAYMCLVMAGRLRASTGDIAGAKAALERAGDQALARGSVVEAAQAYIEAAHAAAELKMSADAHALRDKALLLADSPLLSDDQRSSITRRLQG
jgi:hypothetical protein